MRNRHLNDFVNLRSNDTDDCCKKTNKKKLIIFNNDQLSRETVYQILTSFGAYRCGNTLAYHLTYYNSNYWHGIGFCCAVSRIVDALNHHYSLAYFSFGYHYCSSIQSSIRSGQPDLQMKQTMMKLNHLLPFRLSKVRRFFCYRNYGNRLNFDYCPIRVALVVVASVR